MQSIVAPESLRQQDSSAMVYDSGLKHRLAPLYCTVRYSTVPQDFSFNVLLYVQWLFFNRISLIVKLRQVKRFIRQVLLLFDCRKFV